jgi:hypothetical protein
MRNLRRLPPLHRQPARLLRPRRRRLRLRERRLVPDAVGVTAARAVAVARALARVALRSRRPMMPLLPPTIPMTRKSSSQVWSAAAAAA